MKILAALEAPEGALSSRDDQACVGFLRGLIADHPEDWTDRLLKFAGGLPDEDRIWIMRHVCINKNNLVTIVIPHRS